MVAVYVDDFLVVGSEKGIEEMINCLKNCGFGVKIEDNLTDYLSCKIQINQYTKLHLLCNHICMFIEVKLPKMLRCDTVGAIFMEENSSSGVRTKHVDIRYHFVREHVVDDFIKIVFIKSCDNDADLFMKNVNKDTYTKHMNNFLGKMEDSNE